MHRYVQLALARSTVGVISAFFYYASRKYVLLSVNSENLHCTFLSNVRGPVSPD